jgi:hypothetical protein
MWRRGGGASGRRWKKGESETLRPLGCGGRGVSGGFATLPGRLTRLSLPRAVRLPTGLLDDSTSVFEATKPAFLKRMGKDNQTFEVE